MSGAIYDVALDLRPTSVTFGQWHGVEQRAGSGQALLIESGLAHAFLALEPNTVIVYLNDTPYQPAIEHAIHPLSVGVDWQGVAKSHGIEELVVNDRDLNAATWQEIREGIAPSR
jgi:dTDP-4-dehydrorhamnose 3,5-epimerase